MFATVAATHLSPRAVAIFRSFKAVAIRVNAAAKALCLLDAGQHDPTYVGGVNETRIESTMTRRWIDGPFRPGHMNGVDRQMIVRLQRRENPKRPGGGPWRRYQCYEDGKTIGEFLSRVRKADEPQQAALDDLCWDQNQRFIRLESAEHPGQFLY
jgi:hypothetical protein